MKERPIIMGAESVKAVLEGRKTQTRRVINPHKYNIGGWDMPVSKSDIEAGYPVYQDNNGDFHSVLERCPYGNVGDRLWVRETWFHGDAWYDDNTSMSWKNTHRDGKCTWVDYKATNTEPDFDEYWKSPIFMPRWASRITLEITDIRVERVQDISEEDAIAEGCSGRGGIFLRTEAYPPVNESIPIQEYRTLWNSLNAKRGYPFESNPWVWVLTFKVVQ